MTGFEALIYTDCRPGQGLRGSAGLQFQARSSDAVAAAENLVKDNLLYEPPSRWMAERRPAAQYPPSFAHLRSGDTLATAAGVYLGREANGTREGNQLTHAIVTNDPASYGSLRPAQLFGAPFWSARPTPTTQCDPVRLDDDAGAAHTPTHARDFVQGQPDGPATLLSLVSALVEAGRPGKPRVLFVGDDVTVIMNWLVAGTLLVPRERALELGFKIYSTDPARSAMPIVAVLPEFAGPAGRIDNQLGYVVFDLHRHQHTPVVPHPAARRWVDLFLTEDPRDVVDALTVATESELATGDGWADEAAIALGLAAILHHRPDPRHARAIVGWLRTGPERMRGAYGADVAELFAETPERWPEEILVLLDEVGCDGLLPGKAADVRLALIISEVAAARTGGAVNGRSLPPLPPGEWHPDHDEQARQIVTEALTCEVPPRHFETLLRVANRFGVGVRWEDVRTAAEPFVAYWADHPDLRVRGLPCAAELEKRLIAVLGERAQRGGTARAVVGDGWWERLLPVVDRLELPLAEAVLGAAVRHGDARAATVERHLRAARDEPERFGWAVGALWGQSPPTLAELELVCDLAPAGARPPTRVFRGLVHHVLNGERPTPRELDLCRQLIDRKLLAPTQRLRDELADDDELLRLIGELGHPDDDIGRRLRRLSACPPRLVAMRRAEVVTALARVVAFRSLDSLLERHPALREPLVARLAHTLVTEDVAPPAIVSFYLLNSGVAVRGAEMLDQALGNWLTRVPADQIAVADAAFARASQSWRTAWRDTVARYAARRRLRRLGHPFRRR
ncbi:GTPase-associated protein 1-related protein [Micromonospora globbae]|jgi:hypothetical protein|uniref:GTPase-associated protein 1-related protein n=1 Tax=Micromonospora globbae TaxID=1894969 RepID=A0ABZ1SAA8_9ACTN|nr:GTPase-associated protein 1-related protein [Micromonospora globbae]